MSRSPEAPPRFRRSAAQIRRQPEAIAPAAFDHDADRLPRVVRDGEHLDPGIRLPSAEPQAPHRTGERAQPAQQRPLVGAARAVDRDLVAPGEAVDSPAVIVVLVGQQTPRRRRQRTGPPPPAGVRAPGTRIRHPAAGSLHHALDDRAVAAAAGPEHGCPQTGAAVAVLRRRERSFDSRAAAASAPSPKSESCRRKPCATRTAGRSRTSCGCRPTP